MRIEAFSYLSQTLKGVPLLLLLGCGCVSPAPGQVTLSVSSAAGTPGSTVHLNVSVNTTGTLPTAVQWTITYSTTDISSISVTAGVAATAAQKSIICAGVIIGRLTCVVFGLNTNTIMNGVVAVATLTISPGTLNTSTPIGISNLIVSDANGNGLTDGMSTGNSLTIMQTTPHSSLGLRYVPLEPCRVMETRAEYNYQGRTGSFGPPFMSRNETRTINPQQSTICQIPSTAKVYVLNVGLIPRGSVDYVTIWPAGDPRPDYWTIRSPDGQNIANSAIVTAGTSGINVYASDNTDLVIDISGYYTDSNTVSSYTYYPMTPCRVVDTRVAYRSRAGQFGPPSLNAGEHRSFVFPQATEYCQIPQGAKAYSVTLTTVPFGPLQFLTAWPSSTVRPNISSINSPVGRTIANSIIVPASSGGSIDVFASDKTDLVIDITGYFASDDGQNSLYYFPITQCRVSELLLENDSAKTVWPNCAPVPTTAKGYAANITVIPNGSPVPFITLYPTGQPRPNVSILNAFEGQVITNSTIVLTGANAAFDIYVYRRTEVVVEISGYFGR